MVATLKMYKFSYQKLLTTLHTARQHLPTRLTYSSQSMQLQIQGLCLISKKKKKVEEIPFALQTGFQCNNFRALLQHIHLIQTESPVYQQKITKICGSQSLQLWRVPRLSCLNRENIALKSF